MIKQVILNFKRTMNFLEGYRHIIRTNNFTGFDIKLYYIQKENFTLI